MLARHDADMDEFTGGHDPTYGQWQKTKTDWKQDWRQVAANPDHEFRVSIPAATAVSVTAAISGRGGGPVPEGEPVPRYFSRKAVIPYVLGTMVSLDWATDGKLSIAPYDVWKRYVTGNSDYFENMLKCAKKYITAVAGGSSDVDHCEHNSQSHARLDLDAILESHNATKLVQLKKSFRYSRQEAGSQIINAATRAKAILPSFNGWGEVALKNAIDKDRPSQERLEELSEPFATHQTGTFVQNRGAQFEGAIEDHVTEHYGYLGSSYTPTFLTDMFLTGSLPGLNDLPMHWVGKVMVLGSVGVVGFFLAYQIMLIPAACVKIGLWSWKNSAETTAALDAVERSLLKTINILKVLAKEQEKIIDKNTESLLNLTEVGQLGLDQCQVVSDAIATIKALGFVKKRYEGVIKLQGLYLQCIRTRSEEKAAEISKRIEKCFSQEEEVWSPPSVWLMKNSDKYPQFKKLARECSQLSPYLKRRYNDEMIESLLEEKVEKFNDTIAKLEVNTTDCGPMGPQKVTEAVQALQTLAELNHLEEVSDYLRDTSPPESHPGPSQASPPESRAGRNATRGKLLNTIRYAPLPDPSQHTQPTAHAPWSSVSSVVNRFTGRSENR